MTRSKIQPISGRKYFVQNKINPEKRGQVLVQGRGFLGKGHVTLSVEENDKEALGLEDVPNRFIGTWVDSWHWQEIRF